MTRKSIKNYIIKAISFLAIFMFVMFVNCDARMELPSNEPANIEAVVNYSNDIAKVDNSSEFAVSDYNVGSEVDFKVDLNKVAVVDITDIQISNGVKLTLHNKAPPSEVSMSHLSLQFSFDKVTEASSKSWSKWARDVRRDVHRNIRNDVRREIRRDISRWEREQRNIIRADGDARFANRYLSDREVRALRILKRCPVGVESNLFLMSNDASAVRSMCRILPEFSYVGELKDQYGEKLGIVVYRHS